MLYFFFCSCNSWIFLIFDINLWYMCVFLCFFLKFYSFKTVIIKTKQYNISITLELRIIFLFFYVLFCFTLDMFSYSMFVNICLSNWLVELLFNRCGYHFCHLLSSLLESNINHTWNIPQGTFDNKLGPDRLADPNHCKQPTLWFASHLSGSPNYFWFASVLGQCRTFDIAAFDTTFYVFGYDTVWVENQTHHLTYDERMRYVLRYIRKFFFTS